MLMDREYNPDTESSNFNSVDNPNNLGGNIYSKWRPPPRDSLKINVDGLTSAQCVAATLIKDYKGSFIQGETNELHLCELEEAEAITFYLELLLVKDLPYLTIFP